MSILSSLFENLGIESCGYVRMDWRETPESHIFQMDLRGLTKNEVKFEVHQGFGKVLKVSGYREEEPQEKGEKWHCRERSSTTTAGSFSRQFRLPEDANVDDVKASMHDGVLTVTVPKDEAALKKRSHKKSMVEISGDDEPHPPKGLGRFLCCKA